MPIDDQLTIRHPPLGIGFLSTALKAAGHSVYFIDLPMIPIEKRMNVIHEYLEKLTDVVIGITCVTQSYSVALSIAEYIKINWPSISVIMGGPHVTFTAYETLSRHKQIDYVIMHDGEEATVKLVNAIEERKSDLHSINGLAYRNEHNEIIIVPCRSPEMNLDIYGYPDRSIFDIPRYLENDYETVIMTSRGCPNRCGFCSSSVMGRTYRTNSIEHVLQEIQSVLDMGFQSVFFGDDTFAADVNRIIQLCDAIISSSIKFDWTCNMRVRDVEPKLIEKMHKAGMYRTFIGYESFDETVLTQFRKGSNFKMQVEAAQILHEYGVELHSSMIVGCQNDTWDSVLKNVDFLRDIIRPTIATFNTIEIRPGTDVFLNPEKYGYYVADRFWYEKPNCTESIHVCTDNLSEQDIRNLCAAAYSRFYS